MKKSEHIFGKYFCGNEISEYGRKNGFVDYATLAKSSDAVLCNNIFQAFPEELEQVNGFIDNSEEIEELEDQEESYPDIYQYFIISDAGQRILEEYTNEIVYYCETLDVYIWGVTHFGTSWDYVLTDIPCEKEGGAE